jgi:hypothetical protein
MLLAATLPAAAAATPISLRISDNYYPFVTAEGQPFFWLADPALQLIHDLNEAEMHPYFADRGDKLFAVIRTVVLSVHRFDTFIARSLTESASRDFSTRPETSALGTLLHQFSLPRAIRSGLPTGCGVRRWESLSCRLRFAIFRLFPLFLTIDGHTTPTVAKIRPPFADQPNSRTAIRSKVANKSFNQRV